jgi:hypothetical protein
VNAPETIPPVRFPSSSHHCFNHSNADGTFRTPFLILPPRLKPVAETHVESVAPVRQALGGRSNEPECQFKPFCEQKAWWTACRFLVSQQHSQRMILHNGKNWQIMVDCGEPCGQHIQIRVWPQADMLCSVVLRGILIWLCSIWALVEWIVNFDILS